MISSRPAQVNIALDRLLEWSDSLHTAAEIEVPHGAGAFRGDDPVPHARPAAVEVRSPARGRAAFEREGRAEPCSPAYPPNRLWKQWGLAVSDGWGRPLTANPTPLLWLS
jgi:hypothetical protein